MEFKTADLTESVVKSVFMVLTSLPLTYLAMENYAALTVSINPDNIVGTMINGAMITTAVLVAITVFLASYIQIDFE